MRRPERRELSGPFAFVRLSTPPHRSVTMVKRSVIVLLIAGLVASLSARAAKVQVSAVTPDHNTDGSVLTDLDHLKFEWGDCVASSTDPSGFVIGTVQGHFDYLIIATATRVLTAVYPVGLAQVCIDVIAVNKEGGASVPSNTATWTPPATPGAPVQLGQPIELSWAHRSGALPRS